MDAGSGILDDANIICGVDAAGGMLLPGAIPEALFYAGSTTI